MRKLTHVSGPAYPLAMPNIDTDIIIAAQRLKIIHRRGLGAYVFEKLRTDPDNVFDNPRYRGGPILLAGANFGCGSSREHAVWAMADIGIEVVIAPSFGDLFAANARKNGMLTIVLPEGKVDRLMAAAEEEDLVVDLPSQCIYISEGTIAFDVDPFQKLCLVEGLDEIELTLQMRDRIDDHEKRRLDSTPWLATAVRQV